MSKIIRIATCGVAQDYRQSLVPLIVEHLGYKIEWGGTQTADLIIFGPFFDIFAKKYRWLPKPLRARFDRLLNRQNSGHRALTLFQTGENLRHNHIACDYALSFDLAVDSPNHLRFPYWMEMMDWHHEGVTGNSNPRFGRLLSIDKLMQPLGSDFLTRPQHAAIFASHLREPRETLYKALSKVMPVHGYGPYFDANTAHHSTSNITKLEVLQNYAFNLCPENSLYPGYYTEKIPEAFMAGCLPVTWADSNVGIDFNAAAILNLAPLMIKNFEDILNLLTSKVLINSCTNQPLFNYKPTLLKHVKYIKNIIENLN
jgi:Glycosyltransferase family 10 (fucosyltransferase) C-term/Alpha-(1,3)-fucosyltransferase FucT N-terminal domain